MKLEELRRQIAGLAGEAELLLAAVNNGALKTFGQNLVCHEEVAAIRGRLQALLRSAEEWAAKVATPRSGSGLEKKGAPVEEQGARRARRGRK